ncbi:alpha-glucan family phosphorylase [Herpetosiphon sp. NSE202]|uniref:alpha-glucan family phosphorylase n=1 Tax=Herpetosiphon sp. NSE202 TaxID=3351349 RepID=UPI0036378F15
MNVAELPPQFAPLPQRINRLYELAYNLWWSWQPEAQALYQTIDATLWERTGHNPVKFLREVSLASLEQKALDSNYLAQYDRVTIKFDHYMRDDRTWFARTHPEHKDHTIAYFSAEFGIHESLPIYSGGLGILSGDHCKEASDIGLPFVGVGFLYPQGYFRQFINSEGTQEALYERLNFAELPALVVRNSDGSELRVSVDLPGRTVFVKVWRFQVGRITLLLMDTDVDENRPEDRELSARLYGGDQWLRVAQEIILGIAGVRVLRALNINPTVWHMNEGHSAFLGLELLRERVQRGENLEHAITEVRKRSVFTTHTPVPAGNDAFPLDLIDQFFHNYWPQLGIDRDTFMNIALQQQSWGPTFSMTVLALRLSEYHNGVSELHGAVARQMWQFLYPGKSVDEVPIGHVTNGVHSDTWLAPAMANMYDSVLGAGWREVMDEPTTWDRITNMPDEVLWGVHSGLKHDLARFIRERAWQRQRRLGYHRDDAISGDVNPNALLIGFARRFATYKRATLIFRDLDRIKRILNNPERPVQIIFAGKSHPADEPGKSFIRAVYNMARDPELRGKIFFIEEYDINVGRHLVQSVDVWLNNPRRPLEASGTSGEKAGMNGVPNLSVLDGWWREAYNGKNGWAIGREAGYDDLEQQDIDDAESLYSLLENEVVPAFYERDANGLPHKWIATMKESIRTVAPEFSFRRMLKDYVAQYYVPGMQAE